MGQIKQYLYLIFIVGSLGITSLRASEAKQQESNWQAAAGSVYEAGVGEVTILRRNKRTRLKKSEKNLGYVPSMRVKYKVQGKEYDSVILLQNEGPFSTADEAQKVGENWMIAHTNAKSRVAVTIYYDPENPKRCNLEKGDVAIEGRHWDEENDPRQK